MIVDTQHDTVPPAGFLLLIVASAEIPMVVDR